MNIKLPRKIKKGLKKALLSMSGSGWRSKDVSIHDAKRNYIHRRSNRVANYKGYSVTSLGMCRV